MDPITALLIFYAAPGILTYGLFLGYFQGEFPTVRSYVDALWASIYGLLGPIGLIGVIAGLAIVGGNPFKHGLQFIPKRPEGFR